VGFFRIPGHPRVRSPIWWLAFGGSIVTAAAIVALAAYVGR
jgi:hypothetical protein